MKTIFTAQRAKASDLYTVTNCNVSDQQLIHAAACAVLDAMQTENYDLRKPLILCGSGNNGADGFELACLLQKAGATAKVLYLGALYEQPEPTKKKPKKKDAPVPEIDPALIGTPNKECMSEECLSHYEKALAQGIPVLTELPAEMDEISLFVDAVYGTGMHGEIKDARVCSTFDAVNASEIPVIAIDVPSGVACDSGAVGAHALCAAHTVTMQHAKPGILLYPGAEYAGKITVADIGIENNPTLEAPTVQAVQDEDLDTLLPARPTRSNKGTFGKVLIVGGAPGMAGAVYLAAMAAYRAGAGLVEILTHTKNRTILQQLIPEAVLSCYADKSQLKKAIKTSVGKADAIVLGCGAGRSKLSSLAVKYVLNNAKVPCVVDADALNVIANKQGLLKGVSKKQKPQVIITPHPVEAARLLDKKASADKVLANVVLAAEQLCDKYKVNVLLKDARTLILSHDKNTRYINLSGSTALAGAGSGDILAGYIGGLCAAKTNTQPVATTAALAAYLHGKAGERAEETVGARAAMARDILQELKK
jgi:NAD(P)H-hydrate epimerase